MTGADLYRILQVDPHAEIAVIRAAHRALAATHHPDAGGSHEEMAAINHAWTVLSDPEARAAYDHERRLKVDGNRWDAYAPKAQERAHDHGTILDFGRYAGWSIPEIAVQDADYLEWLARTPTGHRFEHEIRSVLAQSAEAASLAGRAGRARHL